jgi:hypothetical protein
MIQNRGKSWIERVSNMDADLAEPTVSVRLTETAEKYPTPKTA